jgi:hypothetical protein
MIDVDVHGRWWHCQFRLPEENAADHSREVVNYIDGRVHHHAATEVAAE